MPWKYYLRIVIRGRDGVGDLEFSIWNSKQDDFSLCMHLVRLYSSSAPYHSSSQLGPYYYAPQKYRPINAMPYVLSMNSSG